jgi:ketosteroid isomerase-like protein
MQAQDFAAIVNVINLYAVAVDTQKWDLFDRVFTDDATTDFGGPVAFSGLATIKATFAAIHEPFSSTMHVTTNHHVEVSGSTASCLSYVHGRFLREVPGEGGMFESTGWYDDLLVRAGEDWRIQRRSCRTVWWGGNPAVLQTTPDVHVEPSLNSLRTDARAGSLGHLRRLAGDI